MSQLRIENDINNELEQILQNENNYVITDTNVVKLLPIDNRTRCGVFVINAGEQSKCIKSVEDIVFDMQKKGADRTTTVYAVGGGVVGDIAGFTSGIYMRGVRWKNIPTTLLAQVDSAVGGKTGVDFAGQKNLIGLFYEPDEIIIPLSFLSTLSEDDWTSGLGEIIKTCFLDTALYELVQSEFERIKRREDATMRAVIEKCVSTKKKITDLDFRESGARKALNIGHTIGHALEAADNFERSHGEYVLWGMKYENTINKEHISSSFYLKMQTLISRALLAKEQPKLDIAAIHALCLGDKKNSNGFVSLMAVQDLGLVREIKYKPKQFLKELKKCMS